MTGTHQKIIFRPTIVASELTEAQQARIREASPGAVLIHRPDEATAVREAADATIFLGNMSKPQFLNAPKLRLFQAMSAGIDRHMYPEFIESAVVLTGEKGLVGTHLADHAFALLLSLSRGIATIVRTPTAANQMAVRHAAWELHGQTMGIIGLGGTGIEIARRAVGFGMRVIAIDPEPVARPNFVERVDGLDGFHRLLGESDAVAITAPLTPLSRDMFDHAAFAAMRPTAVLVNVSRGEIVEESALLHALRTNVIRGATLDVTPIEPLPDDHPLWHLPNAVITPHTAGASPLRADRSIDRFCRNLINMAEGRPLEGVVDKRKGY